MLWSLTGHLPLDHLEDCFASGKISVEGEVSALYLTNKEQENLNEIFKFDEDQILKIIAPQSSVVFNDHYHLPLEGLFASLLKN